MARLPTALRPLWPYLKVGYTQATRAAAPATRRLSRLRGGWLPITAAETFDNAVDRDGAGVVEQVRAAETLRREVPRGRPPGGSVLATQTVETVPRVAVAELAGGRVLGPYAAVVSRTGALVDEAGPYFGTRRPSEHPLFLHPFPPPPLVIDDRLGVLASRGDANYYHFVLDVLPRVGVLEQSRSVDVPKLWYAPRALAFQRDLLELVGIEADAVVDSAQVPHVQARELVVPGLADAHLRTPPWSVHWLRDRLRDPAAPAGRRIYVTRGRTPNTRIVRNEPELLAALRPLGFEIVDPGALPVREQLRAFSGADVVVAPHGAGLSNLVVAPDGVRVVELFAPDYVQGCYWKIVDCLPDAQYRYVVTGRPDPRREQAGHRMRGVSSDLSVRPEQVLDCLAEMGVR